VVDLAAELDRLAEEQAFSGVVRVDRQGVIEFEVAYGLADRAHGIAATPATRFAAASGNKALTALVVMQLIDAGRLTLSTPAREVLGSDLPLIADDVTIEHLLTHRSGIDRSLATDLVEPGDVRVECERHDRCGERPAGPSGYPRTTANIATGNVRNRRQFGGTDGVVCGL